MAGLIISDIKSLSKLHLILFRTVILTIFLDIPVKKGLCACGKRLDRIEQRPLAYHKRVRRGYLALARKFPRRIKVVKPASDKGKTQAKIRQILVSFIRGS